MTKTILTVFFLKHGVQYIRFTSQF